MRLNNWIGAHSRSMLFLFLVLALFGIFAAFQLPVALFPDVSFPRVQVLLDAGDRPADQMELQVTVPVEEAVRRVPGMGDMRSRTSRGSAEVSVNFDWGMDMVSAVMQVNAEITQALSLLPPGTSVQTRRMTPTVFPILAYSLVADGLTPTQLYDLAQYQLRPLLSAVQGVGRIQALGGSRAEYHVMADPARLRTYGLTLDDLAKATGAANVIAATGRLEDHYKLYLVISDTRFTDLEQIRKTVLRGSANGLVRIEDVATVSLSTVPQWIRVTADGRDAVLLNIYQQPSGNSLRIAQEVKTALGGYRMPPGVNVASWYDQSQLVASSASSVRDSILVGVGLAALVLLVFLRDLKITLIGVIVVPAVLAVTVLVLFALHMSFNIMTLGGMAAAVALIIDDAVVMLEHLERSREADTTGKPVGMIQAAQEFLPPLGGSSAATIVIFLPLAFLTGVTGAFFKVLALTMAVALVTSFLVAWLALPVLAEHFLRKRRDDDRRGTRRGHGVLPLSSPRAMGWLRHAQYGHRLSGWVGRAYESSMRVLLAHPILALIGVLPLLVVGWIAYQHVGTGFMPSMDEGGFILDYRAAPGTSLAETDRLLRQVDTIVQANPAVDTYSRRTGTGLGGGVSEANEGDYFIRLKGSSRPPIEEVMDEIRTQAEHEVPGLQIELAQLMEDLIGDLTAVPQPIEVKLFGDDPQVLQAAAMTVATTIGKIPGVVDVKNGINPAGDALDVHVDRVKAALEGVDPAIITQTLTNSLRGSVTTEVPDSVKMVGVRVWVPAPLRTTEADVGQILLRAPDGHVFPLKRVAHMGVTTGQPQITRENLKRMIAVTGRLSGRDLGSVIRDVRQVMNQSDTLPQNVYYKLGGLYQEQQLAFRGLSVAFVSAVALVFLLLLFLYERFQVALSILPMPLLAVCGVFVGLWVTGTQLNITAIMGMTMIIGIVTEVAIFYFSAFTSLPRSLPVSDALIRAGSERARPIAMTTLAAIFALLTLALGLGPGAQMQQPLAIAIVSGLVIQMPLVLFVMPVLYGALSWDRR